MKNILFILSIVATPVVFAQQDFQFSNTNFNPYLVNPAAGGMTNVMQFESISRIQWLGYEGAPKTFLFSGHSQIGFGKFRKHKLEEFNVDDEKFFESPTISLGSKNIAGGRFYSDQIGPFSKTALQLTYAHHLQLTKDMNMGFGLGFGWSNFQLNSNEVKLNQADDVAYAQFLGNTSSQAMADASAGLVIYDENLFIGLSSTQLFGTGVALNGISTQSSLQRHYHFISKYKIPVNYNLSVEPVLMAQLTKNAPTSLTLGSRMIYKNFAWAGLQYKTSSNLIFQFGGNLIKNLYLNYSYQLSMGKIRVASNGTHEIQLGYYLGKKRNVEKELEEKEKKEQKENSTEKQ